MPNCVQMAHFQFSSHTYNWACALAVFCDALVAAIPSLALSTWKNAVATMNRCVASIHGAPGKWATTTWKGIRLGPHSDPS